MLKRVLMTLAATTLALGAGTAAAEYPERPITLIVGFPAGGNVDIAARQAQPFMEKYLGGSVAVVNKPGAGGAIAYTEAANAKRFAPEPGAAHASDRVNFIKKNNSAVCFLKFSNPRRISTGKRTFLMAKQFGLE